MKILIVEDDSLVANTVGKGLNDAGYHTQICSSGEQALRLMSESDFALVLVDIMLPGMDGIGFCRHAREGRQNIPILMLTTLDGIKDRVAGLEAGADDCLPRPFDFLELLARIKALLRRDCYRKQATIQIADLKIDTVAKRVSRGQVEIRLTARQYFLLESLAYNSGQILSREAILKRVWMGSRGSSNLVEVNIAALRKKIDFGYAPKLIHTIHGLGYVMRTPPERE